MLDDTGPVNKSARASVLEAIERLLLYCRATLVAGRMEPRKPKSIAIIIKEIDNPYYAEVALGARSQAEAAGYTLLVVSSEGEYDAERRAVEMLQAKGVDGLIAIPVLAEHSDLSHLYELRRRNYPFVLLEAVRGVPASIVDIDNVDGSRRAAEHLIELGHTRIVHFAGPDYSMHTHERIDGVRRACSASQLLFGDDDVITAGAHLDGGYNAGLAYFRDRPAHERPTGVTCYNDLVAIGLCRALVDLGIGVPDDVSVVGFDDIPLTEFVRVPLTTVRVPKFRMGELAAEMLIRQVESKAVVPPQHAYLEARVVVRRSTRALTQRGIALPARGALKPAPRDAPVAVAPAAAVARIADSSGMPSPSPPPDLPPSHAHDD